MYDRLKTCLCLFALFYLVCLKVFIIWTRRNLVKAKQNCLILKKQRHSPEADPLLALAAPQDRVHEKQEQDQKKYSASVPQATQSNRPQRPQKKDRKCFYCHKPGLVITSCHALKRKEQLQAKESALPPSLCPPPLQKWPQTTYHSC